MTGIFLTENDKEQFDKWSKEDIYEAYLSEYNTRIMLNKQLNEERRKYILLKNSISRLVKEI